MVGLGERRVEFEAPPPAFGGLGRVAEPIVHHRRHRDRLGTVGIDADKTRCNVGRFRTTLRRKKTALPQVSRIGDYGIRTGRQGAAPCTSGSNRRVDRRRGQGPGPVFGWNAAPARRRTPAVHCDNGKTSRGGREALPRRPVAIDFVPWPSSPQNSDTPDHYRRSGTYGPFQ